MLDAILSTLSIMGWLGLILLLLVIVNVISGTVFNVVAKKEKFDIKRMLKGIGRAIVFYIAAALGSIAFTMLPYINNMITEAFGVVLLSDELLQTLSSVGVLGIVISTIVVQGKKAINNTILLAGMASETEEITWKVEDE